MSVVQISSSLFRTRLYVVFFFTVFFTKNFSYNYATGSSISDNFDLNSSGYGIPRLFFLREDSWCYMKENDFDNFTCTQPIKRSELTYNFRRVFHNCASNETLLLLEGNSNELLLSRSLVGSSLSSLIKFTTIPDLRTVLDLEIDWSSNILYFLYRTKRDVESSGNLVELKLAVVRLTDVIQKKEIIPYRLIGTVIAPNERSNTCLRNSANTLCGIERTSSLLYHPGLARVVLTLTNEIYLLSATRAYSLSGTDFEVSALKFKVPSMERFTLSGVDWIFQDLMIRLAERNEEVTRFEIHYLHINKTGGRVPLNNLVFLDESYVFRINNGGTRNVVITSETSATSSLYYKSASTKLINGKSLATRRPFSFSSEFFITVDNEQRETLVQYVAKSSVKNSRQFVRKEIFNDVLVTRKSTVHYCAGFASNSPPVDEAADLAADLTDYDRRKDIMYISTILADDVGETARDKAVLDSVSETESTKLEVSSSKETSQAETSQAETDHQFANSTNSTPSTVEPTSSTISDNANMKVMALFVAGQFSLIFFLISCLLSTTCVICCIVKFKSTFRITRKSDKNKDYELGSFGQSGRYSRAENYDPPTRQSTHEETSYRRLDNSCVDKVNRLEQHRLCPDV